MHHKVGTDEEQAYQSLRFVGYHTHGSSLACMDP
jgi:hypothetical protein